MPKTLSMPNRLSCSTAPCAQLFLVGSIGGDDEERTVGVRRDHQAVGDGGQRAACRRSRCRRSPRRVEHRFEARLEQPTGTGRIRTAREDVEAGRDVLDRLLASSGAVEHVAQAGVVGAVGFFVKRRLTQVGVDQQHARAAASINSWPGDRQRSTCLRRDGRSEPRGFSNGDVCCATAASRTDGGTLRPSSTGPTAASAASCSSNRGNARDHRQSERAGEVAAGGPPLDRSRGRRRPRVRAGGRPRAAIARFVVRLGRLTAASALAGCTTTMSLIAVVPATSASLYFCVSAL